MNGINGNHQQDICEMDICTLEGTVIYVDRDGWYGFQQPFTH